MRGLARATSGVRDTVELVFETVKGVVLVGDLSMMLNDVGMELRALLALLLPTAAKADSMVPLSHSHCASCVYVSTLCYG